MMHFVDSALRAGPLSERTRLLRRRILRAVVAGCIGTLVAYALIKGLHPDIFEQRADLVFEQCAKTGLAAFALTLLCSLARSGQSER